MLQGLSDVSVPLDTPAWELDLLAAFLAPALARDLWLPHLPVEVGYYKRQDHNHFFSLLIIKELLSVHVPRAPAPMAAPVFHQLTASPAPVPMGEPPGVKRDLYSDNVINITDGLGHGASRERTSAAALPVLMEPRVSALLMVIAASVPVATLATTAERRWVHVTTSLRSPLMCYRCWHVEVTMTLPLGLLTFPRGRALSMVTPSPVTTPSGWRRAR